jgi:hypothetical protein
MTGGPVQNVPGEGPGCKGRVAGARGAATFPLPLTPPPPSFDGHLPLFVEGEHRLVGQVWEPPMPGSPPGPPPDPGPPEAGDGPPRPGHPGPPKPTPFPPPPRLIP